jgi:hypothetical protein
MLSVFLGCPIVAARDGQVQVDTGNRTATGDNRPTAVGRVANLTAAQRTLTTRKPGNAKSVRRLLPE